MLNTFCNSEASQPSSGTPRFADPVARLLGVPVALYHLIAATGRLRASQDRNQGRRTIRHFRNSGDGPGGG